MQLLCPICRESLNPATAECGRSHRFVTREGVLRLLEPGFEKRLGDFESDWRRRREMDGIRTTTPSIIGNLPFSPEVAHLEEWRMRCLDVGIVRQLICRRFAENRRLRVLDVGAFNGWLCHQLARQGHRVTGVDYFADPYDGLGAHRHHGASWQPIQMDLTDLSPLGERFDLVVMNHGLHFFPEPAAQVAGLLEKVGPGGLLVTLGLLVFGDPRERIATLKARAEAEGKRFEDFLLRPAKGYLDLKDLGRLRGLGLRPRAYPGYRRHNLKTLLKPTLPRRMYGYLQPVLL